MKLPILYTVLFIILLAGSSLAATTLYEHTTGDDSTPIYVEYNTAYRDDATKLGRGNVTANGNITAVTFEVAYGCTPTCAYFAIKGYVYNNVSPSLPGTAVCTSDNEVNQSTLTPGTFYWLNFTFTGCNVTAGTPYWLVFGDNSTSWAASHYMKIKNTYVGATPADMTARLTSTGWATRENYIQNVKVYFAEPVAVTNTTPPTWVSPTPADGSTTNTTFTLNASCGENRTTMWLANSTANVTVLSNSSIGYYTPTLQNLSLYTYSANCWNASSGYSTNTTARTVNYSYYPTIAATYFNYTDYLNGTGQVNTTPLGGTVTNSNNISLNTRCDNPADYAQIILYRYEGGTWTIKTSSASLYNHTLNYPISLFATYSEFNVTTYCINTTTYTSSNYSYSLFKSDYVFPSISFNASNEFRPDNLTKGNPYDNNLTLNVTFTDNNALYAYEMNITRLVDGAQYNYTNASISGTAYSLQSLIDVSGWPSGAYSAYLAVADSHTDEKIDAYEVTERPRELIFRTAEGNRVTIASEDDSTVRATKEEDRYSFAYEFTDRLTKERVFHVTSDKPITYLPKSTYKAHFVILNERAGKGGNWIDFEGENGKPVITRIDPYHYTVTFPSLDERSEFNSIGGLNTYSTTILVYRGNITNTMPDAYHLFPFDLTLYASTYTSETHNVTLTYDGVTINANRSVGVCGGLYCEPNETHTVNDLTKSAGTYNYSWRINTTLGDGNYTINYINGTHIVNNWTIYTNASCYGSTDERIRFYSYLEDYPSTLWNATAEMYLNYSIDYNSGIYQQTNITYATNNNFSVCISPVNLTFYMDNYLKYTVSGGFTHRYYDQNETYLNNTLTQINLFNFNDTTGISTLRVTARDAQTYSYKLNIIGVLQRFYVGEGVWRTVQMDRSGDYGLLLFNIKEGTTDYRIQYYDYLNNLLLQTQSVKFSCSSGVCDVTQILEDYAGASGDGSDVTANYSFDNATKILTVNWTGPATTTSDVTIRVTHETMAGQSVACTTTQSGNAGTYTCNLSAYNSAFFVTLLDNTGIEDVIVLNAILTKNRQAISDNLSLGDQAAFSFLLLLVVSSLGLFSPVAVILSGLIGMFMLFIFGVVGALLLPTVIIAIVIGIVISLKVRQ